MAATDRFEIPPEMRALAEKSVEQARQAFDSFISAAHRAVSAFEGQAETARRGAKDVTENAMTFAQHNIASSFELAEQLVRARDVEEVLETAGRLHQAADAAIQRAGQGAGGAYQCHGQGRYNTKSGMIRRSMTGEHSLGLLRHGGAPCL